MQSVYCISGLGADENIFKKLEWNDHEVHFIHWLIPDKNESIESYASRLATQIKDDNPILVGVSFGGIMAIEIAKKISASKIVIISSVKNKNQMPNWLKLFGRFSIQKLIPSNKQRSISFLKFFNKIENYYLGVSKPEEREMVEKFRSKVDPLYLKWAIKQVLTWNNEWQHPNTFQIQGTRDRIFPLSQKQAEYSISNAGHFMVYTHAKEISKILNDIIK